MFLCFVINFSHAKNDKVKSADISVPAPKTEQAVGLVEFFQFLVRAFNIPPLHRERS